MNGTRRSGLRIAGIATALWLGAGLGFAITPPEAGVNIGAALLAFLAIPVSIGASVTLLVSLRGTPRRRPRVRWIASILAGLSLIALPVFLLLDPYGTSAVPQFTALGVGVGAFLASSALFAVLGRRRA